METRKYKVYRYHELTGTQKEKALERYSDINIDCEWWDYTEDELKGLGFELVGFDLGRGSHCTLKAKDDYPRIADKIIKEHGESTKTRIDAENFLKERDFVVDNWIKDDDGELVDEWELDGKIDVVESEFHKTIEEDYLFILKRSYEFLTSDEAIEETIEANDYWFTEDGKIN